MRKQFAKIFSCFDWKAYKSVHLKGDVTMFTEVQTHLNSAY
jgi:hypothetical protein